MYDEGVGISPTPTLSGHATWHISTCVRIYNILISGRW